jgi:hypothetical protein
MGRTEQEAASLASAGGSPFKQGAWIEMHRGGWVHEPAIHWRQRNLATARPL